MESMILVRLFCSLPFYEFSTVLMYIHVSVGVFTRTSFIPSALSPDDFTFMNLVYSRPTLEVVRQR